MLMILRYGMIFCLMFALLISAGANPSRPPRKSLLDSDPEVVYFERYNQAPLELSVIADAPVFSDRFGNHRLGTLKANQTVKVEAITDKVYRVRGQGKVHGIAGWVSPKLLSAKNPDFVETLKNYYHRQIQVQAMIDSKSVCTGMTEDEVTLALGKPTKTSTRNTDQGMTAIWEYVEFKDVDHFITRTDPTTGQVYRQLTHTTREEKNRTNVEFINHAVSAVEKSQNNVRGADTRIIVPPIIFGW